MPDIARNRRRIWRKTGQMDSNGREIIEDMEYDILQLPNSGDEIVCPSDKRGTRARTNDGTRSDSQYVGIYFLSQNDEIISTPFGPAWGGLRRTV